MESKGTLHARFVCLQRLGKSIAEIKRMLGLKQNEIDDFNGSADINPSMRLNISNSEKVRNGKYAAYLTDKDKVILINAHHFYFVEKLDGEITVSK